MRDVFASVVSLALLIASIESAAATCIRGSDIENTERPSDKTILFHMRDKSVYRNDLPVRCPGLKVSVDGFTFQPTDPSTDQLCDGMVVLRLSDVGHASCILGAFTKLK